MRALLVLCACALYHLPMGVWATDEEDAEILSATDGDLHDLGAALESVLGRFAALLHGAKHRSSAASLFEAYNRFKDEADGVQTLGNQEVRELLKDLDVSPAVLRGNIATTVTRAVDSDGDKRISEPELSAAIAAVGCWVDGASETPLPPRPSQSSQVAPRSARGSRSFSEISPRVSRCAISTVDCSREMWAWRRRWRSGSVLTSRHYPRARPLRSHVKSTSNTS